jgi:hypothetical protein
MAQETESSHVLVDYRAVHFNVPQAQAFNTIRYYEQKLPSLATIIIAAVVNKENLKIGMLWSEVAIERGFQFKTFTDFDEAEKWLLNQNYVR